MLKISFSFIETEVNTVQNKIKNVLTVKGEKKGNQLLSSKYGAIVTIT